MNALRTGPLTAAAGAGRSCVRGRVRLGPVTKQLAKELCPGEIAVIAHQNLDSATAADLVAARPAGVVNALSSLTGLVPVEGARLLLQAGVPVLDEAGPDVLDRVEPGQLVRIVDDRLLDARGRLLARGRRLTPREVETRLCRARRFLPELARGFIDNTVFYLQREKRLLVDEVSVPPLVTRLSGRPAVVVVRSDSARRDLPLLRSFIRQARPVLVGVDGGADVLLAERLRPDLVVGDMDSVSDRALCAGRELVVHAYANGRAPGLSRVRSLGRFAHVMPSEGTSEDVALLLAYAAGARPIVVVGSHTSLQDFLERGRAGMASTLLVRMRVGHVLVDARGLAGVFPPAAPWLPYASVLAAAGSCVGAIALTSEILRLMLRLFWIRLQAGLLLGGVG